MPLDAANIQDLIPLQAKNPSSEQIDALQAAVGAVPQVECPVQHGFGPGFYARSMLIPAGTVLVGKEHATEHIFMITEGDISITTDAGVIRVQAPYQVVCKPGMKRAGYAHTDTVCVNIHITNETDLAKLEAELIVTPALPAPAEGGE
jgi:hypothetical protein